MGFIRTFLTTEVALGVAPSARGRWIAAVLGNEALHSGPGRKFPGASRRWKNCLCGSCRRSESQDGETRGPPLSVRPQDDSLAADLARLQATALQFDVERRAGDAVARAKLGHTKRLLRLFYSDHRSVIIKRSQQCSAPRDTYLRIRSKKRRQDLFFLRDSRRDFMASRRPRKCLSPLNLLVF
jgi:hypothetical protein